MKLAPYYESGARPPKFTTSARVNVDNAPFLIRGGLSYTSARRRTAPPACERIFGEFGRSAFISPGVHVLTPGTVGGPTLSRISSRAR